MQYSLSSARLCSLIGRMARLEAQRVNCSNWPRRFRGGYDATWPRLANRRFPVADRAGFAASGVASAPYVSPSAGSAIKNLRTATGLLGHPRLGGCARASGRSDALRLGPKANIEARPAQPITAGDKERPRRSGGASCWRRLKSAKPAAHSHHTAPSGCVK